MTRDIDASIARKEKISQKNLVLSSTFSRIIPKFLLEYVDVPKAENKTK